MVNVLVLGGTTEASALVAMFADRDIPATLSYAGRTDRPKAQPVPTRVGGFGGIDGLVKYLRDHQITHLIDATHPFAAKMSHNAVQAAQLAKVPLIAFTRPPWKPVTGDNWRSVPTIEESVTALDIPAQRIFLALGRMHVAAFAQCPQHNYVLRFVDQPAVLPTLPHHMLIIDRGPFSVDGDRQLLIDNRVTLIVCKNAGGTGAEAKLKAARELQIPVLMIERPHIPERLEVYDAHSVCEWLHHHRNSFAERGV